MNSLLRYAEKIPFKMMLNPTYALVGCSLFFLCLMLWNVLALWHWQGSFVESTMPVKVNPPTDHLPQSLNSPFFGAYKTSLSDESIEHSQLNYVIVGIMFSTQPKLSQAVIRDEAGTEKLYRVGDELKMGVTIEAIEPFRVVVSNQGNFESLNLHKDVLRFDTPPKPFMMQE